MPHSQRVVLLTHDVSGCVQTEAVRSSFRRATLLTFLAVSSNFKSSNRVRVYLSGWFDQKSFQNAEHVGRPPGARCTKGGLSSIPSRPAIVFKGPLARANNTQNALSPHHSSRLASQNNAYKAYVRIRRIGQKEGKREGER